MKVFRIGTFAIDFSIALSLVGCAVQSQVASPHVQQIQMFADRSGSSHAWMLPEAKKQNLLYATQGCGGTCIFSFPSGKLVGELSVAGNSGICSDRKGDVFFPSGDEVLEYAHGGTTPIATLSLPGDSPNACAVDPSTGNLAVVFLGTAGNIAIFPKAQGQATQYSSNLSAEYCGYDDRGNLFVDGIDAGSYGLSELTPGSPDFKDIAISQDVGAPGQLQWDGTYITWEGVTDRDIALSRLTVSGSQATIVGTTHFEGIKAHAAQSSIYGNKIVIPYSNGGYRFTNLAMWNYPQGGHMQKKLRNFGSFEKKLMRFLGVAVSVSKSSLNS